MLFSLSPGTRAPVRRLGLDVEEPDVLGVAGDEGPACDDVVTHEDREQLVGGLGVLLAGVATHLIIVGVLGFIVMAAGAYVATVRGRATPDKGAANPGGPGNGPSDGGPSGRSPSGPRKSSTFLQNLEEKWDKRNQGER